MKKSFALLLAMIMVFTLAACGGNPNKKNIVGVWHVVDEEAETDYGLGIEFTKDGKVRYGLTEDVFTAIADGDDKAAEDAMKALDFLITMEYKIKSETEMDITVKALMGLKKETETITYSLDGDNLTFDDVKFTRATADGKVSAAKDDEEEKEDTAKKDEEEKEYDKTAWVKDNTSVSFYFMYKDGVEDNELLTLKVLDDKAVMYSKKGEEEERPITIYEETDEGVVVTQLIYIGDQKGAYRNLPKEGYTLKEYLPSVGNIMMTFGARADKDNYKNAEFTGKTEYIGRKCDVIEKVTLTGKSTTYLDRETGIVLKSETLVKSGEKETRLVQALVTELEYGKVSKSDVAVDLSDYKLSEEGEETEEEKEPEENKDEEKEEAEYSSWPNNEFTKLIPTPEIEAKVLKADTIGKMFTIDVEWTLDEGAVYAQQLAEAGFGDDCAEKFSKHGYIDRTENGVNVQLLEIGGKVNVSIMPVEQ